MATRVTSANNNFDAIKKNSVLFGAQFSENNRFPVLYFIFYETRHGEDIERRTYVF